MKPYRPGAGPLATRSRRRSSGPRPQLVIAPAIAALVALAGLAGCAKKSSPTAPVVTRSYLMGFSAIPPRLDFALELQTLDLWVPRADAGLILNEVPWDSLLAGTRADSIVLRQQKGLADYYRARGLRVVVSLDPTNGLDRSSDSAPLVAAGRSLTEPAIRNLYRAYAVALDTLLKPDYFSVGSETNLVRAIAPAALYSAEVTNAAQAAAAIRAVDTKVKLYTTVQVEVAWGRLVPAGSYVGIAQDRSDFPFDDALGLSSYPYLAGFADPDSLPRDYYTRLTQGAPIPLLMIEGGWSSTTVSTTVTSLDMQRRYIVRQGQMLDDANAVAWFQITFTDLDLTAFPPGVAPFAYLGLVDVNLAAKPALAEWDTYFKRQRR
jgi:hypothetical protein